MWVTRVKNFIKTVLFVSFALITQGSQLAGVIVIAIAKSRPWELSFMLIGFFIGRQFFGRSYHAESLVVCSILTWVMFYFLLSAVPSFHTSITLPAIFGMTVSYILTFIKDYVDRLERDKNESM